MIVCHYTDCRIIRSKCRLFDRLFLSNKRTIQYNYKIVIIGHLCASTILNKCNKKNRGSVERHIIIYFVLVLAGYRLSLIVPTSLATR